MPKKTQRYCNQDSDLVCWVNEYCHLILEPAWERLFEPVSEQLQWNGVEAHTYFLFVDLIVRSEGGWGNCILDSLKHRNNITWLCLLSGEEQRGLSYLIDPWLSLLASLLNWKINAKNRGSEKERGERNAHGEPFLSSLYHSHCSAWKKGDRLRKEIVRWIHRGIITTRPAGEK